MAGLQITDILSAFYDDYEGSGKSSQTIAYYKNHLKPFLEGLDIDLNLPDKSLKLPNS